MDGFWEVIAQSRSTGKKCTESARDLLAILSKMPSAEIEAVARFQEDLMRTSYRWDLWGAAFVINGGCSDDGFDYFRGWLMLQGRDVWEAALGDPAYADAAKRELERQRRIVRLLQSK